MDHTIPTETTKLQREVIRLREIIASYEAARKLRLAEEEATAQPAAPAVDAAKFPPLPEPWITNASAKDPAARHHYAEDQMIDYAHAAVAAALALPVDAAELGKLKALAEAATPGPWDVNQACSMVNGVLATDEVYVYSPAKRNVAIAADIADPVTGDMSPANAAYIAAANPAAILRIAALVAQQAARIAELEALDWISVSESLPDDGQLVAALYWPYNNKENAQAVTGARLHDGAFYDDEGDVLHPPSHWMPLPAIPTATQEGK